MLQPGRRRPGPDNQRLILMRWAAVVLFLGFLITGCRAPLQLGRQVSGLLTGEVGKRNSMSWSRDTYGDRSGGPLAATATLTATQWAARLRSPLRWAAAARPASSRAIGTRNGEQET